MTVLTKVDCTAIPDGFVGDAATLNLSLVLSPRPTSGADGFDLFEWPSRIQDLAFEVQFGSKVADLDALENQPAPDFGPKDKAKAIGEAATAWWQRVWATPLVYAKYVEVLTRGAPDEAAEVQFYDYSMLADIAKSKLASDLEFEFLSSALRGKPGEVAALGLPSSLRRQVERPHDPAGRLTSALALIARQTFADLPIGDGTAKVFAAAENRSLSPGLGGGALSRQVLASLREDFIAVRDRVLASTDDGFDLGAMFGREKQPWNPLRFTEASEPSGVLAMFAPDRRDERYDPEVFGEVLDPPVPTDFARDTIRPAAAMVLNPGRKALAQFDYAMMPDAKRGDALRRYKDLTPEEKALNAAERHAAAFQAHPALRKFLRMIVDIRIPLADIPAPIRTAGKGVVAVKVTGPGAPDRMSATAFILRPADKAETSIFEPCPEAAFGGEANVSKVASLPLDTGVVMLNIGKDGEVLEPDDESGERRFRLEVLDGMAAIGALRQELKSAVRSYRLGVAKDKDPPQGSGVRTRGLMLLDRESFVPEIVAQARNQAGPPPPGTHLFYAEDLIDGYRPDAVRADEEVFPLAARKITYDVLDALVSKLGLPPTTFAGIGNRDHGYILASTRQTTEKVEVEGEDGSITQKQQVNQTTSDHLFCWTGNNLGLKTPDSIKPADYYDEDDDYEDPEVLPLEIGYDFADGIKGPILRVGGHYRYMLRARKLNGSSVTLAIGKSMVARHALGDGKGGSYVFMPVEPSPPPVVLVPRASVLTPPAAGEDDDTSASQTIIVNAGETAVRFLVSPKIEFDLAEQQGQFDVRRAPGETEARARERALERRWSGAYRSLRRDGRCGAFPLRKPDPAAPVEAGVQQFEVLAKPDMKPGFPYFVDASLCTLGSELVPEKATTLFSVTAPVIEEETSFWARTAAERASKDQGFAPEKVRPVLLEVFGTTATKSRILKKKARTEFVEGRGITVSVLRVEIAPGDTFSLETWANRIAAHAVEQPIIRTALARLEGRLSRKGLAASRLAGLTSLDISAREEAWQEITDNFVHPTLAKRTTFRLEHPVRQPLKKPEFFPPLFIGATRRISDEDWASVAASPQNKSVLNGEVAYAWGKIGIDRKTTRRVWAEAIWRETDPALLCTRTAKTDDPYEIDPTDLWTYDDNAIGEGRLFDIDQIPPIEPIADEDETSYLRRANVLDLVHVDGYRPGKSDELGSLRKLTADFKTDKARRLLVRLVAVSRFLPPSASLGDIDNVAASADRADFIGAIDIPGGPGGAPPALPTGVREIWLPATRPPSPPRLMKEQGTLYERRLDAVTEGLPAGHRGVTLTHVYRCWLDRDWFSSGEGELLAVVCRHPDGASSPSWVLDSVSRWGSDMTMQPAIPLKPAQSTAGDATFLDWRQIICSGAQRPGVEVSEGGLPMPTRREQVEAKDGEAREASSRKVAFALLKPQFHKGVGRWYCDIEIRPAASFRVHLKLSLARYQPNAIAGCHLSSTVTADAFLLHQPWTFSAKRDDRRVTVTATGPAYIDRAPMTLDLQGRTNEINLEQINRPLIVAELERLGDGEEGPLPVVDGRRVPVRVDNRNQAGDQGWPNANPGIPEGYSRWTLQLDIPPEDTERQYAVRVSLLSAHANSEAANELSHDGPLIHLPEPLVVQMRV